MSYSSKNPKVTSTLLTDQTTAAGTSAPSGAHRLIDRNGRLFVIDSSGVETSVSANQELSMIPSPSTKTGGATTGANGPTAADTTTSGDLPLEGVIPTAIKLTSATAAGAEASHYWSKTLTVPAALQNRKTKVEFWMRPGTNFLAGEWTVSVYSGSTRMPLSTDSSGATTLPSFTGKFATYFDADTSSSYTVRFSRPTNAGTNAAVLNIAGLVVGPGIQAQGAVLGPAISFTPTFNNISAPTVNNATYARAGSFALISFDVTLVGAATGRLEFNISSIFSGATVDESSTGIGSASRSILGSAIFIGSNSNWHAAPTYVGSGSILAFRLDTNAFNIDATHPVGDVPANTNRLLVELRVPISQWAGSGVVNIVQNDAEYLFNTDTTTTAGNTNTTSFGYGPGGTAFVAIASTTDGSITSKYVQTQTPIQATDEITFEIQDTSGQWLPLGTENSLVSPYTTAGTKNYGVRLSPISATQISVDFANNGRLSNSGTYAANGALWSDITGRKWRVRKKAGGQAVGFSDATETSRGLVKAATTPGLTANVAVAAGFVGEKITATLGSVTFAASTTPKTVGTLTLNKGKYLVFTRARVIPAGSAWSSLDFGLSLTDNAQDHPFYINRLETVNTGSYYVEAWGYYDITADNTPVYTVATATYTGTAPATGGAQGSFFAIRIV